MKPMTLFRHAGFRQPGALTSVAVVALAAFAACQPSAALADDDISVAEDEVGAEAVALELPVQADTLSVAQRARFEVDAAALYELHTTTVQQLGVLELPLTTKIAVTLGDEARVIELSPHSMRSENFTVLVQGADGSFTEEAAPPVTTYRGRVLGEASSEVAASIIDGKVHATIVTDAGAWAIQPLGGTAADAPADLHAVYRVSDVVPAPGVCGVDDAFFQPQGDTPDSGDGGSDAFGTGGRTQIAFDADVEYYQANGNSTTSTVTDIEMVMNQVGLIYQNQFSICYVNEGVIVRTAEPDPYSTTNSSNLLCQFRNEWNNNVSTSRDIAHLMTGKNLAGSTIGVAWVGVVCNVQGFSSTIPGCGNTANIGYGLSQTLFSTNLVSRTGLTAHEIGHNYNACHCNQSTCTGSGSDGDCGIMWSSAGTQQSTLVFGTRSSNSITAHRNSRNCLSTCTSVVYVDNTWGGTENGTISFPYDTLSEGIRWVQMGGTVRIFSGSYPSTRTMTKYLNLEAHNGVVDLGD